MNRNEAIRLVMKVRENAHDSERAHDMEDNIHRRFIDAIASGQYNNINEAREVALEIKETEMINFPRLCQ